MIPFVALAAGALFVASSGMTVPAAGAVSYEIDSEHTHVSWSVDRFGFARTMGSFVAPTGQIRFDAGNLANSSVEAQVSMGNLRSDLAEREDIVRGKFWVNAAANPVASFRSTAVTVLEPVDGKPHLRVEGVLDFAGRQAPAAFDVTINKQGKDPVTGRAAIGISARGAISRKTFGLAAAPQLIGDEIEIRIESVAIAPPS
ncbi:YceI family protein [Arenimonas sp.]|uniref:YceI family protein n=1 Tax=Arenimonas sp. TaxID=1872635 RepID=UPI0039E596E1